MARPDVLLVSICVASVTSEMPVRMVARDATSRRGSNVDARARSSKGAPL
jgi:hypothetical protein